MPNLDSLPNLLLTMFDLLLDVLRFIGLSLRPNWALVAENPFVRKQLALYLERKVKSRRARDATPFPPSSLAAYRQAFYPSGGKDDPGDAELLLGFPVKHHDRLRPWQPDAARTYQTRLLAEHRRRLVADRTCLTLHLTALLKGYFPQALGWRGDWSAPWTWGFLAQWPTLGARQQASLLPLPAFFRTHTRRRPEELEPLLEQIRAAQSLTSEPAVIENSALMAQILAEALRALAPALKRFDQILKHLFASRPDQPNFESFPGAGEVLAPRLLAAWGRDRNRFTGADHRQRFSGVAPVTKRSGITCWVHWRLACPFCGDPRYVAQRQGRRVRL